MANNNNNQVKEDALLLSAANELTPGTNVAFPRRMVQACSRRPWVTLAVALAVIATISIIVSVSYVYGFQSTPFCAQEDFVCRSNTILHSCNAEGPTPCLKGTPNTNETIPANLTLAMFADSGNGPSARSVFQLIKNESADFVIHSGDFDYLSDPKLWDSMINDVFGDSYPFFAAIGNHDDAQFYEKNGYQQNMYARLQRAGAIDTCIGDLGVNTICTYRGIAFVLSGVGTEGDNHEHFLDSAFSVFGSRWRIAAWHKNQHLMQLGDKTNEAGWDIYERARRGGAIIATGHEHSYARSKLMTDFPNQQFEDIATNFTILPGKTIAHVTGTGGVAIRPCLSQSEVNPWWAKVLCNNYPTETPFRSFGALFCKFNTDGNQDHAYCYFKDIDGVVHDTFDMWTGNEVFTKYTPTSSATKITSHFLVLLTVAAFLTGVF